MIPKYVLRRLRTVLDQTGKLHSEAFLQEDIWPSKYLCVRLCNVPVCNKTDKRALTILTDYCQVH